MGKGGWPGERNGREGWGREGGPRRESDVWGGVAEHIVGGTAGEGRRGGIPFLRGVWPPHEGCRGLGRTVRRVSIRRPRWWASTRGSASRWAAGRERGEGGGGDRWGRLASAPLSLVSAIGVGGVCASFEK